MAEGNRGLALPSFERPPVVEVAIGVEFLPLPALTVVPMVELRPILRDRYPHIEEQPALPSVPVGGPRPELNFQIATGIPPLRIWFLSEDRTELLQVQGDRLVLNWRADFKNPYPRYRQLAPTFFRNWEIFEREVRDRALGELQPIVAEVTYVNRVQLEDGESLFDVLSVFESRPILRHAQPELQMGVPLVDDGGTEAEPHQFGQQLITAGRVPTAKGNEVHLSIATRVEISRDTPEPITDALQRAHVIGSTTFVEITKPTMHDRWGRTQ
jgi:uncharacterized protein (TIGR04255 family)